LAVDPISNGWYFTEMLAPSMNETNWELLCVSASGRLIKETELTKAEGRQLMRLAAKIAEERD
jgi:hypothetical protein